MPFWPAGESDRRDPPAPVGQDEAAVPAVWQLEVANVVLISERLGRITEAQAAHLLDLLGRLPIRVNTLTIDTHRSTSGRTTTQPQRL